jgi:hypothetical protein
VKVVFVDYTEKHNSGPAKTEGSTLQSGKFIQIRKGDAEYLVLSPKQFTPYHADLVEKFCLEEGIEGSYNSAMKRFNIHDPAWVIAGGGRFEIDRAKKCIRLYDNSMAYGKFDPTGLKEKILMIKELSDYEVSIA